MANETTKRQPDQQDSTTGSKTGSAGQQATQGSHDTRKAEERYGSHRDPHVPGGAGYAQQNPQGKQETQEQPGQSRERRGATGEHTGNAGSQNNPPPAQQGQHGGSSQNASSDAKRVHQDESKKERR
jgi:hypothetical protein